MSVRVTLIVPIEGKENSYVRRESRLPIAPFVGLTIGSHVVTQVYVCQGWNDSDEIEVHCSPVTEQLAATWCKYYNWKMEESD